MAEGESERENNGGERDKKPGKGGKAGCGLARVSGNGQARKPLQNIPNKQRQQQQQHTKHTTTTSTPLQERVKKERQ